jgi:Zn ribbon nucleic-acid-binding protein
MMGEFRVCTNCGYQRGFHVYFREAADGGVVIGLICPNCGQSFDLAWREGDVAVPLTIKPGEIFRVKS